MAVAAFETLIILFLAIGSPLIMAFGLLLMDIWGLKKSIILYFDTDKTAKFMRRKVKEGVIKIGKKRYFVDKIKPPSIPSGIFIKPFRHLYILKWNRAVPLEITERGIEVGRSPSNLSNLMENKTLDQLLTPKKHGKEIILYLIIGVVMGAMFGYILAGSL